ncbi:MAG: transporter [Akkermansiaceae bacterium]|jgi:hypothetical protein|nr:transporter [Akkermansiaceae bacterium]
MKPALLLLSALVLPASALPWIDPVPSESMRDLAADRPDTTESPITVDRGHVQLEASLYDWSRERSDDVHTFMAMNLKVGIAEDTDLQFVWDAWQMENLGGPLQDRSGSSDLTIRLKQNLWGNDGGTTAFAVFPFVTIPIGGGMGGDEWEAGLILPFSMELTDRIGLGLMAEFDWVADGARGYDLEIVHSAVLGFDLTDRWGCFTEYVGVLKEASYEASVAAGVTCMIHSNLMLDAGLRVGLNDAAEDFGLFTGWTIRY